MATQYDKAKRKVDKYSRQLERERMGEFRMGLGTIDSIYRNLATTQQGLAASMTTQNDRVLAKLSAMTAKAAKASDRGLTAASGGMVASYGGAYSGAVGSAMAPAEALGQQVVTAGEAATKTAKGLRKAGIGAMEIQEAGVKEAQAAAQYAISQAAIARAQADAQEVARMNAELALYKLQNTQETIDTKFPGISNVADLAANISKTTREAIAKVVKDANGDTSAVYVSAIIEEVKSKLGLYDPAEIELLRYLARQILTTGLWKDDVQGGSAAEQKLVYEAILNTYNGDVSAANKSEIDKLLKDMWPVLYGQEMPEEDGGFMDFLSNIWNNPGPGLGLPSEV